MFLRRVEKGVIDGADSDQTDASGRKHSTKFNWLKDAYEDPLTEVHLYFYPSVLLVFANYNLFLQRGDPLAHKVNPVINELTRKLTMRFMLPKCYQGQRLVKIDIFSYFVLRFSNDLTTSDMSFPCFFLMSLKTSLREYNFIVNNINQKPGIIKKRCKIILFISFKI